MRTLRRLAVQAPRHVRRRRLDLPNVTSEPAPSPAPEEVFDRITGPYGRGAMWAGDEET